MNIFLKALFILLFMSIQSQSQTLKKKFERAYTKNFRLLSDEIKIIPENKGYTQDKYWLVRVVAKSEGLFIIRFQFEHGINWGRRYNDHEYHLNIGKNHYLHVGDTILVPIPIGEHIKKHKFMVTSRYNKVEAISSELRNKYRGYDDSLKLVKE